MTENQFPAPITYVGEIKVNSTDEKASGFYNELNQAQYDALQEWKKNLISQNVLPNLDNYDDLFLLRFLRARKFDLEKTMEMFKKFLQWRIDMKVDELRESYEMENLIAIKKLYPHGYHRTDKEGRPIYIELYDKTDVKALFKITTEDKMVKYYIKQYERQIKYIFPACSAVVKRPVEQSCTILDANGIGITSLFGPIKGFVKLASDIGQDYYPEMLGKMTIVNVGFLFRAVWSMVKAFIDPKTQNKINLLKSTYKDDLLALIDEENLPSFFGGKCTCSGFLYGCLGSDIGPWNPEGGITQGGETTKIQQ
jgi:hypothetical protein